MTYRRLLSIVVLLVAFPLAAHDLDTFKKDYAAWEVKDWGDSAQLKLAAAPSDQAPSLRLDFEGSQQAPHSKGIVLRRSLLGTVGQYKDFTFDVFVASKTEIELEFSFEADRYYQLPPRKLQAGWNRDIHIDLIKDAFSIGGKETRFDTHPDPELSIGSMMLAFKRQSSAPGQIYLSRVRSQHTPAMSIAGGLQRRPVQGALSIASVQSDKSVLKPYETMELTIDIPTPVVNPFDGDELRIEGLMHSPSGDQRRVAAFFYSGRVDGLKPATSPVYKLRFTPESAGAWSYEIIARRGKEEVRSPRSSFTVVPVGAGSADASAAPGFIRVDKNDPYAFAFDSGASYYPLGHNVAWLPFEDYESYFQKMAANGENWTRIWMTHWSFGIEWKAMGSFRGLTNYNLQKAEELDRLLALAAKYRIYVQLVFDFHGAYSTRVNPEWLNNPYNALNGGFLKRADQFFSDARARAIYKKRLDYIVARWGASPQIMAWEFFNEVSFVDGFDAKTITAWHDEMSRYVKSIDPYRHLRTTSYAGEVRGGAFALETIDFSQYHSYGSNFVQQLRGINGKLRTYGKPYFIGEFGSNSSNGGDDKDKEGIFLHAGIWAQFMQDAGGNAMPWWWDSHIEANQLYGHFAALARYAAGIDRRQHRFTTRRERLEMPVGDKTYQFDLLGLQAKDLSLYWLCDSMGMRFGDRPQLARFKEVKIALPNFPAGSYDLEFWDTRTGAILESRTLASEGGQLRVELPLFRNDLAIKARPHEKRSIGRNEEEKASPAI